eukprot:NODE_1229_length_643_cov_534.232323_g965_i0.p1 GENE.NODE_1229_length_643_cov_534.232323_g965_i0~~NODE_1229_length_643_cov_534.232323_g965_i0.p1  ORF type:complete len:177 (+),score=27.27 NODE_1229_length_643_cov_534.232323_g965_i0:35-565(+)
MGSRSGQARMVVHVLWWLKFYKSSLDASEKWQNGEGTLTKVLGACGQAVFFGTENLVLLNQTMMPTPYMKRMQRFALYAKAWFLLCGALEAIWQVLDAQNKLATLAPQEDPAPLKKKLRVNYLEFIKNCADFVATIILIFPQYNNDMVNGAGGGIAALIALSRLWSELGGISAKSK